MKHLFFLMLLTGLFVSPESLWAQTSARESEDLKTSVPTARQKPFTIQFYLENDGTFLKPNNDTDRYYTNGTAFNISYQPDWAKKLFKWIPFQKGFDADHTAAGYVLGQLMFTPNSIKLQKPAVTDRPYAGYLYVGTYWQRANQHTFDHLELNVGVVGPSALGKETQRFIHQAVGIDKPKGWDTQLGDEITFQLYFRRKWRMTLYQQGNLTDLTANKGWAIQAIPQVGLALGTVYRNFNTGVTLRAGFNLPDDFGPGRLADLPSATGQATRGFGAYGFIRLDGKVVEHNLFLEGSTFRPSHNVAINELVGELQAGLVARYQRGNTIWQASYAQTFQSREFERQAGTQAYGSMMLGVTVLF